MNKKLTPKSFIAHLQAATLQAGYKIEKQDDLALYVIMHGEPMRCNLTQAYHAYRAAPHRLDELVNAHLDALRSVPPSPPPTEEQAAHSLLPVLQTASWIAKVGGLDVPPPVQRPFVGPFVITYVFDFFERRVYINKEKMAEILASPGATLDTIHAYALVNLRLRVADHTPQTSGRGAKTMIACETHDGHAAARVLLPDLMEKWADRIPGHMLIGIPNHDFMIAFSDRDHSQVAAMSRRVRRDAGRHKHPLCADLFIWRDGRVQEYRPRH